jgi:hypothetical protein
MMDYPLVVFAVGLSAMWLSMRAGEYWHSRRGKLEDEEQADLGVILTASLTLLGLIIGFTFSMAISRYDLRKSYEAAEANAIGTEFARAELMPADAAKIRALLKQYLSQRVLFYTTRNARRLEEIQASTVALQADLWSAVMEHASTQPTAVTELVVSGMNDVLNSQSLTQAAWWNRIPFAAWVLMAAIAICCSYLVGYTARRAHRERKELFVLPLLVSISFYLIAEIDSPRGGFINVHPQNLGSVFSTSRSP